MTRSKKSVQKPRALVIPKDAHIKVVKVLDRLGYKSLIAFVTKREKDLKEYEKTIENANKVLPGVSAGMERDKKEILFLMRENSALYTLVYSERQYGSSKMETMALAFFTILMASAFFGSVLLAGYSSDILKGSQELSTFLGVVTVTLFLSSLVFTVMSAVDEKVKKDNLIKAKNELALVHRKAEQKGRVLPQVEKVAGETVGW